MHNVQAVEMEESAQKWRCRISAAVRLVMTPVPPFSKMAICDSLLSPCHLFHRHQPKNWDNAHIHAEWEMQLKEIEMHGHEPQQSQATPQGNEAPQGIPDDVFTFSLPQHIENGCFSDPENAR